jgi:transketolase
LRNSGDNLSARGAYRLKAAQAERKVVLIATGSEVEIAVATAAKLEEQGIGADVVSMPSMSRFLAQDAAYRGDVLPAGVLRVSIEAGTTFGWEAITGLGGLRVGIDRFGASAPAEALYDYFGLTADKIAPQVAAAL